MNNDYFAKQISLRPEEELISVLRQHPVTYLKQIIITIALILLAFFLMFYLFSLGAIGVALFLAILLTGVFYGLREFYIWFFNIFAVTSQRIIDIDQTGFFNKTVSAVEYEKILDICYSVKGAQQTLLRLGTIKINASGVKLIMKNVHDAPKVNQLLADLIREQTGKAVAVKKVADFREIDPQLNSQIKEKIADDFLAQDELAEYDEYELSDLLEEYVEVFGELPLKKYLVDELEAYDEQNPEEKEDDLDDEDESESDFEDENEDFEEIEDDEEDDEDPEVKPVKFKKKKL